MKSTTKRKFFEITRKMPPLYHSFPGEKFDIRKSRVIWWLTKQPEILNYLFSIAAQCEGIVYDHETRKWRGVDFEEDEDD